MMTKQKKYLSILLASIAMVCCLIAGLMQFGANDAVTAKADGMWKQASGNFTVEYQEDGVLLSTAVTNTSSVAISTHNYYENFELEFTVTENNMTHVSGTGPVVYFGDGLRFFLASGLDKDGSKRSGIQFQPETSVMHRVEHITRTEVVSGWYNLPMEATVKITVVDNTFKVEYKDSDGTYKKLTWWPQEAVTLSGVSTLGSIGFGFDFSKGSYKISNVTIKNLNEASSLFDNTSIEYVLDDQNPLVQTIKAPADKVQAICVGNTWLTEGEFTVVENNEYANISILGSAIIESGAKDGETVEITVYLNDGSYSAFNAKLNYRQFAVKVMSKGEALETNNVIFNDVYTLPTLPEDAIGWYLDNKKLTENSIKVYKDLTIEAKYPTDSFNVTFHYIDVNYEKAVDTKSYLYGTLISPELNCVQSASGYYFVGWGDNLVLTEDMDVYAEYSYEEVTDDFHTVKYNDDGSITLTNSVTPPYGAILQTYNYYSDFELEFTISDNNSTSVRGTGPAVYFGDGLFYLLASGYDSSNNKRQGNDAQPECGVLVYDNTVEIIPGWYNTPLEATVKIIVVDNTFDLFIKGADGVYYRPNWWPNAPSEITGGYSTTGKIGFGFRPSSTGSYTLSDISVKNLKAESNLFANSTAEYDVSSEKSFSVNISTSSEIQSLWVGNEVLSVEEYSVSYEEGQATIEIGAEVMENSAKYLNDGALNISVFTTDAQYDSIEVTYTNLQEYTVQFVNGDEVTYETSVVLGSMVVLPVCPEDSIGWYYNGKKINASVICVYSNMVIEARFKTDMFTVEFVYRNIRNNEKVEVREFVYGTQFTDELFVAPVPYDYIFIGWDYSGLITEDIKVTAQYERYASGKDFTLDFDGILKNKNYINFVSNNYPGGYTDLANNYMYSTGLYSGSAVYTNQQYKDFEMTLDIVHYSGGILGDNNITLTFGSEEQEVINYYEHPYSIVMSLNYNESTGEYYSTATLLNGRNPIGGGRIANLCDATKITLEDGDKGMYNKNIGNSGLSPDGKYVQLRLSMRDGTIALESKHNVDSEWTTAFSIFLGRDILGYLSFGFNTEYLYPSWGIGVDNVSVKNLNNSEGGLATSISDLTQNEEGVYEYMLGTTDIVTNVNFKMQAYGGVNVIVYDDNGAIVDDISVDIIKEEIYEIGDFITLDKRVLGKIFSDYATGDTLRIDVIILAKLDWGGVALELTKPDGAFTVEYWNGNEKLNSVTANLGDTITLPTDVTVSGGYVFGGWVDEYGNQLDTTFVVVDDYKLNVLLVPNEYTVRFMNYDGTVFYQTKVKYGQKISLPLINPFGTDTIQFIEWENKDLVVSGDVDINGVWSGLEEGSSCKGSVQGYDAISLLLIAGVAFTLKKKNCQNNKVLK